MAESGTVDWRLPGWFERFRSMVTRRLGGPVGTHRLRSSGAWAYLLATISWVICMIHQIPCRAATPSDNPDRFGWMCYTDLTALYFSRGQATGGAPYSSVEWEYPVLTGYFATLANSIGQLFGAVLTADAEGQQLQDNGNIYFAVSAIGLFACLIWLIASLLKMMPDTPVVVMAVAISPILMANSLINWDLLVIALAAAGLAAWARQRYVWAGLWLGLGVAAKLYPIVIIAALLILCLRPFYPTRRVETVGPRRIQPELLDWVKMAAMAMASWLLVNLPMMATHFDGWSKFYSMNSVRGADLGSLWYALQLLPESVKSTWSSVDWSGLSSMDWMTLSRVVMIAGYIGLAALIFLARRTPTVLQIAYLAVTIMVVCNVVYSPQYVLWMLPLLVLIRPVLVDVVVFTAVELYYFIWIWIYLRVWTSESPAETMLVTRWMYIVAIIIRVAATWWLMGRVVRDIIRGESPAPELATSNVRTPPWLRHRPEHAWGLNPRPLPAPMTVPAEPRTPRSGEVKWEMTVSQAAKSDLRTDKRLTDDDD